MAQTISSVKLGQCKTIGTFFFSKNFKSSKKQKIVDSAQVIPTMQVLHIATGMQSDIIHDARYGQ